MNKKLCLYEFCHTQIVDEVLKEGHVPPRHGVYVERKEKIKEIRDALYKLKDKDGYISDSKI